MPSILMSNVTVKRIDKGSVKICWKIGHNNPGVSIYLGDSPDTIDRTFPVARVTKGACTKILDLDPDFRYYFEVVPDGGSGIITGERRVHFEGAVNFRDLGGYETADGHRVKWGRIFRSGSLDRFTDRDQALFRQMRIKLVCDFRTQTEVKNAPDRLPEDGIGEYLHLPIKQGEIDSVAAWERMKKGDISWLTKDFMINGYIRSIDDFAGTWGIVFNRLAESGSRPMVIHCTAGKDRAGVCAALILLALGVPEETIIYDHGISNIFIANLLKTVYEHIRSFGIDAKKVIPYFTAPSDYIVSLLNHIRETYGSATDYLCSRAGVNDKTLAILKRELLE